MGVFNGVYMDIRFPPVLYKKIQNLQVGLEDLAGIDASLYHGLS